MNNITGQINIYHKKRGFSIFQTTDIETINALITPNQNKIFYVGGIIELYDSDFDANKKWKVEQIEVSISDKEHMLPPEVTNWQGNKNPHNIQIIIYVDEVVD
jgi:hypothetical protein